MTDSASTVNNISTEIDSIQHVHTNIIPDTIITIEQSDKFNSPYFLIPVSIAILAIVVPIVIRIIIERKRINDITRYLFLILEDTIKKFKNRIKHLKDLSNDVENWSARNLAYTLSVDYSVNAIKQIPFADIHSVLLTKAKKIPEEKIKKYREFFNSLEYFTQNDIISSRNFIQYHNDLRRYERDFKLNFDKILRLSDRLKAVYQRDNTGQKASEFLLELARIIHDFNEEQKARKEEDVILTLNIIHDKYLVPLKELCKENLADEQSIDFLELVIYCNYAVYDIINLRKLYSEVFKEEAETMTKKNELLEKAIEYFKK